MMPMFEIVATIVTILLYILGLWKLYEILVADHNPRKVEITDEMAEGLQDRLDKQVEKVTKRATEFAEFQAGIILDYATEYMYKEMNSLDKYEKAPEELVADVDANFNSWLKERHPELKNK